MVLDPFAGVALGGIDAMVYGLHYIGCELEDKFVQLGQQNIDLWDRRYGGGKLRRWGTATILQGDSRRLCEVLEGARAEGIISSPPFSSSIRLDGGAAKRQEDYGHIGSWGKDYGTDPAQLGNMPTGKPPQVVIGSPPYAEGCAHTGGDDPKPEHVEGGDLRFVDYGDADGQLAAMREGDVDAVIASPPHGHDTEPHGDLRPDDGRPTKREGERNYGKSDGQLAQMREGDVDAVIASPPWQSSSACEDPNYRTDRQTSGGPLYNDYGDSDGQLAALPEGEPPAGIVSSPPQMSVGCRGAKDPLFAHKFRGNQRYSDEDPRDPMGTVGGDRNSPEKVAARNERAQDVKNLGEIVVDSGATGLQHTDTFWSAAKAILLQCHQVLAPGGVAIFVTKRFVRDKQIVEFSQQWADLCQSCGFELVEWIKAWLVEERGTQYDLMGEAHIKTVERKSFFRRLYEYKARAAEFWLSVSRSEQATYLWQAHNRLWQEYNKRMGSPKPSNIRPTHARITSAAQGMAYRAAGEPDVETDTQIDWEDVLVFRKPDGRECECGGQVWRESLPGMKCVGA